MQRLDDLAATIPQEEEILARGMASGVPVVVTPIRLVRSGQTGDVSIPFVSVSDCETWDDSHRWGVRLRHAEIDPALAPFPAHQWWRWFDRRGYRKTKARLSRETVLTFSTGHTAAAKALRGKLQAYGIACTSVPSPVVPQPGASAVLRRAE